MNLLPIGNRVFVEIEEEKTRSGFHIPEAWTDPRIGIVRAIGNGRKTKHGTRIPITGIKIGDRVLVPDEGKKYITVNGKVHWVVIASELIAVLE